jgi:hypothetical protein
MEIMKIGRYEYGIDTGDKFMNDGVRIQLISQSKRPFILVDGKTFKPHPVLSNVAIKQLMKMDFNTDKYKDGVKVYTIK